MSSLKIRRNRTRTKIKKAAQNPILSVLKSNKHIYGQIVDNTNGQVICAANTLQKEFVKLDKKSNIGAAEAIGKKIAEIALKKGIKQVVFDKSGYKYHGKVKALAEKVRESGIVI